MPYTPRAATRANPAQAAANRSNEEAKEAAKAEKNPDAPGKNPENLTVVETKIVARPLDTRSNVKLSEDRLATMTTPDLRTTVEQRGYLKGEKSHQLGRSGLISKILEGQAEDPNLVEDLSHPDAIRTRTRKISTENPHGRLQQELDRAREAGVSGTELEPGIHPANLDSPAPDSRPDLNTGSTDAGAAKIPEPVVNPKA